jgi:hypothetical protein
MDERSQAYLEMLIGEKYHGMLPEEVLILKFIAGLIPEKEFEGALKGIWNLNIKPTGETYEPFYARIQEKLKLPKVDGDLAICTS